jgi:hypothetical protein
MNVGINNVLKALFMEFEHPCQGHMTVASGTEAVGRVVKPRFEEGSQEAPEHFLSYPVANHRNAEGTQFSAAFVEEVTAQGFRFKGTVLEVVFQRAEVLVKVGLKHFEADLIHTCGSPVAFDSHKAVINHLEGDSSGKRVSFGFNRDEQVHELSYERCAGSVLEQRQSPWGCFLAGQGVAGRRSRQAI